MNEREREFAFVKVFAEPLPSCILLLCQYLPPKEVSLDTYLIVSQVLIVISALKILSEDSDEIQ